MLGKSASVSDIFGNLTPSQIADLFPKYYRDALPEVSKMMGATAGGGRSYGGGGRSSGGGGGSSYVPSPPSLTDQILKEAGVQRPGGKDARVSGTGNLDGKFRIQKMVYDGFTSAGFSHKQAMALTAEVGRENGYRAKFMFGVHSDPANAATNLGMLSMQGPRLTALKEHLAIEGRIGPDGSLIQDQETINSMARFYKKEMQTTENSAKTQEFLANPDIDRDRAGYLLGTGYIRWRYDDPRYASHHEYRNQYYSEIENSLTNFDIKEATAVPELSNQNTNADTDLAISGLVPGEGPTANVTPTPAIPFDVSKLSPELKAEYEKAPEIDKKLLEEAIKKLGYEKANAKAASLKDGVSGETATAIKREAGLRVDSPRFSVIGGHMEGVNQKLANVLRSATNDLPEGYHVKVVSGKDDRSTTKNHPNGLAIDVKIFDDAGNELPYNKYSPGWKTYEKLYRSVKIRGEELYPGEKFIWGGAWYVSNRTPADAMHYQIVDPTVAGSAQTSGAYSFENGLNKPFADQVALSPEEREAWDNSVRERIKAERIESATATVAPPNESAATQPPVAQTPPGTAPAPAPDSSASAPPAATPAPASDIAQTPLVPPASPGQPTATPVEPPAKDPARLATGGMVPNSINEDLSVMDNRTGEVLAQVSPNEKLTTTPNGLKVESAHQQVADQTMAENSIGNPSSPTPEKAAKQQQQVVGGMKSQAVDVQKTPDYLGEIASMGTVVYSPSQARAMRQATLGNVYGHYGRGTASDT